MNTLDATVSMLEAMPEDERLKVFKYTQQLFVSKKSSNPFPPVDSEQVLSDLAISREQTARGEGLNMEEALMKLGKEHGFL